MVMEEITKETNVTYVVTTKIHGDKMRMDQQDNKHVNFSVIVNLATRDAITLMHVNKTYMKRSGEETRRLMEAAKKSAGGTNLMDNPPAPPVATGKSEKVDGYETELYTWAGPGGLNKTLWVAKDYPDFDKLKTDLAKRDHFNRTGPHKAAQPEVSQLPGMVIKTENDLKGRKMIVTLSFAKAGPVDPADFEIPANYVLWSPDLFTPKTNAAVPVSK